MDEFNKRLLVAILSFFAGLVAQSWQHRPVKKDDTFPATRRVLERAPLGAMPENLPCDEVLPTPRGGVGRC